MNDRLAVLGYLVARSHIRGFSIVESDEDLLPFSASILLWGEDDEVLCVRGVNLDMVLDAAIDTLIGGPDLDCGDELHA